MQIVFYPVASTVDTLDKLIWKQLFSDLVYKWKVGIAENCKVPTVCLDNTSVKTPLALAQRGLGYDLALAVALAITLDASPTQFRRCGRVHHDDTLLASRYQSSKYYFLPKCTLNASPTYSF